MQLNSLPKNNKKKLELEEVSVLEEEKLPLEDIKVKNQDLVLRLKVLREVKCLYTEDYPKEVLNQWIKITLQF